MKRKLLSIFSLIIIVTVLAIPINAYASSATVEDGNFTYSVTPTNVYDASASGGNFSYLSISGDYWTYTFTGDTVTVYGLQHPAAGSSAYTVDNGSSSTFDEYSASVSYNVTIYTWSGAYGTHTIKGVTGSGGIQIVDKLVYSGSTPTSIPPTATGVPPTATATGTPPTATATGTPPTATATGTPPTATATGTPPTATPTGATCNNLGTPSDGGVTYDDNDAAVIYAGTWTTDANVCHYGGSAQYGNGDITINYTGGDLVLLSTQQGVGSLGIFSVTIDNITKTSFIPNRYGFLIYQTTSDVYISGTVGPHTAVLHCSSTCEFDGYIVYPTSAGINDPGVWIDDTDPMFQWLSNTWIATTDTLAYQGSYHAVARGKASVTFTYYGGNFSYIAHTNSTNQGVNVGEVVAGTLIPLIGDSSAELHNIRYWPQPGWGEGTPDEENQILSPVWRTLGGVGYHTITVESIFSDEPASFDGIVVYGLGDCSTSYFTTPPAEGPNHISPNLEIPSVLHSQMESVVQGQYIMIQTTGGPWQATSTGTSPADDRYDTAISWDAVTWTPLSQVAALCREYSPAHVGLQKVYLTAASNTLYIRVNDSNFPPGFADNVEVGALYYTESLAFEVGHAPPCGSSYSFDGQKDWVASISLNSTSPDTPVGTALIAGEYYVAQVASGSWLDGIGVVPRYDMQDKFIPDGSWVKMNDGTNCASADGKTIYFQAVTTEMHLRVNDQDNNFANNTGHLGVNIYHTTFTPPISACEATYAVDTAGTISKGTIPAYDQNGTVIASGGTDLNTTFTNGGWYMLQTLAGPWMNNGAKSYDLQVSEAGGAWQDLKTWSKGACIVKVDTFGHLKVYFQVPSDISANGITNTAYNIKLRAAYTGSYLGWVQNTGSMDWKLYSATDLQLPPPDGTCDYVYDPAHRLWFGNVEANNEQGAFLDQGTQQARMVLGQYYAIVIRSDTYHWQESAGGPNVDAMQISENFRPDSSGATWSDLPDGYSHNLCSMRNGGKLIFFIKYLADGMLNPGHIVYGMRVKSSSYSNNTGHMEWDIYPASPGSTIDPWSSCYAGNTIFPVNNGAWIPVTQEQGTYVNGTLSQGGLDMLETYMLQTTDGPWLDGPLLGGGHERKDIALSADDGATWHSIDRNNPDIDCAKWDALRTWVKVYFTTKAGQKWKIRVNDVVSQFGDNGGNMGYKLYAVQGEGTGPGSTVIIGGGTVSGCVDAIPRPTSMIDVPAWIDYWGTAIQQFLLWCPRHTDALLAISDWFAKREPFATINEFKKSVDDIQIQMTSYNWTDPNAPPSIITDKNININQVLPFGDAGPWNGGPLIDFHGASIESAPFYSSCLSEITASIGSANLARGVCWGSAWARETGASFLIQLSFDVGFALVFISHIWNTIMDLFSMLTGIARKAGVTHVLNVFGKSGE